MSQSLSPECTPLKQEYDSCFNSWFEGYLEPAVAASSSSEARAAYSKKKAEEFNQKCGKIWEQYKTCVQKSVKDKGLDKLLQQAREENPLIDP
ncbi:mitochondrial distribution/morphology family 35/apoptosis, partial [Flammula alnicola]